MKSQQLAPGFVQQFQQQCDRCEGTGQVKTSKCHMCQSSKTKQALDELYLFIERGTPDGHEETFRDAADEYVNVRAGEVKMKIIQLPHDNFTREGETLKMSLTITLKEALLGFSHEITHLDGHKVTIAKSGGQTTQHGEVMRINGEGMPKFGSPSDSGDLLVTFTVANPETLNPGQQTLFKQFFQK